MPKLVSLALVAGVMSAALFGMTQQKTTTKIREVPIQPTSPASGQQMFTTYCAVCHGPDGAGNGPAAAGLKAHPADLTVLRQKNGGTFPAIHVESVLQFGVANAAHGTAEMPVWGGLMLSLHKGSQDAPAEVNQRIMNLTAYLKQIQK